MADSRLSKWTGAPSYNRYTVDNEGYSSGVAERHSSSYLDSYKYCSKAVNYAKPEGSRGKGVQESGSDTDDHGCSAASRSKSKKLKKTLKIKIRR